MPELITDQSYLKFFVEFIIEEVSVQQFTQYLNQVSFLH